MSAHRVQVHAYVNGQLHEPGADINYTGPVSWIYEPLDPKARAAWLKSTADPDKVRLTNWTKAGRLGDPAQFQPAYAAEVAEARA